MQPCKNCGTKFEITGEDLRFYEKVALTVGEGKFPVEPPSFCPGCRLQRRLAYRNQLYVYMIKSSATGKQIFSMYPESPRFPVMENDIWWGDSWDALDFGREIDFSRPFFEQFDELIREVPHYALSVVRVENSDYCNNCRGLKDCYLVFNTSFSEECLYCENVSNSKDCVDCTRSPNMELCYSCTGCSGCYNVQCSSFSEDCIDSYYLLNCRSCRNCFGCVNLRRKEYCIYNEQYSKTDYLDFIGNANLASYKSRMMIEAKVCDFFLSHPRPHAALNRAEDVSGDFLTQCRDVHDSFFVGKGESLRYCFNLDEGSKDCHDFSYFGKKSELMYECVDCGINCFDMRFCYGCWDGDSDLTYCWRCASSEHCIGSVGLRKQRYCIFNKQYSPEEYEKLAAKLINHMQQTGEWGEFYPINMSPIPYNNSIAIRHFPLTQGAVNDLGLKWYEKDTENRAGAVAADRLPDRIDNVDGSVVTCSELSGRPFRITAREIKFYKKHSIPLPRMTYDERMESRARLLGGTDLYRRECDKTGKEIITTFSPQTDWIVWDRGEYEREFN